MLRLLLLTVIGVVSLAGPALAMDSIAVSPDHKGFVLVPSGKTFHPWGHNYASNDGLDDPAKNPWEKIDADLAAMREMHANLIRIHLRFAKFMDGPDKPNEAALKRLSELLTHAEQHGIYVDITGLACYGKDARAAWYDALPDKERWAVQARFWEAVAKSCADSPAVFCYDLVNEPVVFGTRKDGWYTGNYGGYEFLQRLSLDQASRPPNEVAAEWAHTLTTAIRKQDKSHLITIGMLPIFAVAPKAVEKDLDFISVHIYPSAGKVDDAIANLRQFAIGKPLVVEETFPLSCSVEEERDFLLKSRGIATGWVGHYLDKSEADLKAEKAAGKLTIGEAINLGWDETFRAIGPEMLGKK
ncbi:MAG TPA: cellulase family glycosylhydrolase [Tepidisphaeraceae bacterium]|nr:cellulase family glycosylhydrolase [Tepidisphaeraceae bacterium]